MRQRDADLLLARDEPSETQLMSLGRPAALLCIAVLPACASACGGDRYCRLVVEDPSGIAAEASELVVVVGEEDVVRARLGGARFPLTQVLARGAEGEVPATVEAWSGDAPVGRGHVTLLFAQSVETVTASLAGACDDDADCDDGVFANGAEKCAAGVCTDGALPCVAAVACVDVEANEELAACVVTPRHERCEPIITETGDTLVTFCDAVAGCLPGESCVADGAECASRDPCSVPPLCVAGRCIAQGALPVDDANPCTLDLCDAVAGVLHLEDLAAVGNGCATDGGGAGICLAGACVVSRCGDGYLDRDGGEACDDGDGANSDVDPDACRTSCALPSCGDGVTDLGEDCDDQNTIDTDACIACAVAACGDGFVRTDVEACDDENTVDSDGCVACADARCGDGVVQLGVEECDDENDSDDDACLTACVLNTCGDGARDPATEECDDGNDSDDDACLVACRANVCGDGRVNGGVEACDDANTFAQDACLPGCIENVCGDGVRDFTDEECDDGNATDFDGCSDTCDFVAWRVDLGAAVATTSAVVAWSYAEPDGAGGSVTRRVLGVVTAAGTLVALARESGAELWRYDTGAAASAPPSVGNFGVYIITDDGVVHGNALGGPAERPPWTFALDRPSSGSGLTVPPGNSRDGVIAVDSGGKIYQLDHLGALRDFGVLGFNASYDVSTDARAFDPAAAVCASCTPTAIHGLNPGGLAADNGVFGLAVPMAGELWGWQFNSDCAPVRFAEGDVVRQVSFRGFRDFGSGSMNESPFYATLASGVVRRATVDSDGTAGCAITVTSRVDATATSPYVTPPLVTTDPFTNNDAIYVVDAAGSLHRLVFVPGGGGNPAGLDEAFGWPIAVGAPVTAPPALGLSGDVFVADDGGRAHAYDGIAALELWSLDVGAAPAGSPLVEDGAVFIATVDGFVRALERGDAQAPPTVWSRGGGNARGSGQPAQCAHTSVSGSLPFVSLAVLLLVSARLRRRPRGRRRR